MPNGRDDDRPIAMNMPHRLSGRYELSEILGLGGTSEVHLALDVRSDRYVAVKTLRADLARDSSSYLRFRREAQHVAALNHPTIVAIYDTGEVETAAGLLPYIVMEYVDGVTLRNIVHRDGPMEPGHSIEVIADACHAFDFSHRQGIVHRDVKPSNIMIDRSGAVKVMDFGIARTLADTTGAGRLTQPAAGLCAAAYLSPEQASGEVVDARSDLYSLGCVLYEMITGEPPFVGSSPVAVADQHVRKDPVPPSQRLDGISPALDAVVLKALAKNPENRYQSAAAMRTDLIRMHSGQAPMAPKVFTPSERNDLLTMRSPQAANDPVSLQGRTVRRWLTMAMALIVLTIMGIAAVNAATDRAHPVRVPDLRGEDTRNAVATLRNLGLRIRGPIEKADAAVPFGQVIDTDPDAGTTLASGDEVTINVSTGPERHQVPNCSTSTVDDCMRKLADAGFDHPILSTIPSSTTPEKLVVATVPAAGQLAAVTDDITIQVSTGPKSRRG